METCGWLAGASTIILISHPFSLLQVLWSTELKKSIDVSRSLRPVCSQFQLSISLSGSIDSFVKKRGTGKVPRSRCALLISYLCRLTGDRGRTNTLTVLAGKWIKRPDYFESLADKYLRHASHSARPNRTNPTKKSRGELELCYY